jgi:hypothetical protein
MAVMRSRVSAVSTRALLLTVKIGPFEDSQQTIARRNRPGIIKPERNMLSKRQFLSPGFA